MKINRLYVKDMKNILYIIVDELRYDVLGCAGHRFIKTPNIDVLANDGVIFGEAYCNTPLCVPSRVSMMTGQYVINNKSIFFEKSHHIGINEISSPYLSFLKDKGYKFGLIGKNHCFTEDYIKENFDSAELYSHFGKESGKMNDEEKTSYDFRHTEKRDNFKTLGFMGEGLIDEPEPVSEDGHTSIRIAHFTNEFINQNADNPFFLMCSIPDPHWPTVICEPYYSMYKNEDICLEEDGFDFYDHNYAAFVQSRVCGYDTYSEKEKKRILSIYYGMVTMVDKAVGRVIDNLKEKGLYEKTAIVFCSDHGSLAGRFGMVAKTRAFYDPLIRIPLIMRLPDFPKGKTTNARISGIDIMPTLFDYLGFNTSFEVDGKSFLSAITSDNKGRDVIVSEIGRLDMPSQPFDKDTFEEIKRYREKNESWFWFCDYTTNGRSICIKIDSLKYCWYTGLPDFEELFDLENDPYEKANQINNEKYYKEKDMLKSQLIKHLINVSVKK